MVQGTANLAARPTAGYCHTTYSLAWYQYQCRSILWISYW